jgi:hypothetical protein
VSTDGSEILLRPVPEVYGALEKGARMMIGRGSSVAGTGFVASARISRERRSEALAEGARSWDEVRVPPSRRLGLVASALVWLAAASAQAGNDDGVLVGNEAAMTGGAVTATTHDGTSTWYNPAGLASMSRDSVDVSGNAIQLRISQEPGLISSTTGETNDGGYLEIVSIPSATTLARRIEPGVTLAIGLFAPRYQTHEVRTGLDATSGASTARWTLSSAQSSATYHAGGAIGLRLSDQLRIGISLFGVYRDSYDSFQTAGLFRLADGTSRLLAVGGIRRIRSFGAELGFGIQWEPHPGVVIGLSARSPGLELATQIRDTTTSIDAAVSDVDPDSITFAPEDDEALAPGIAVLTPGRFTLAFAHRFARGWIDAEIDVQPPLDVDSVIQRQLVWNVRVGGRYEIDDHVGVGVGAFTDNSEGSPIAAFGRTRVDFYGGTLGLEYRTSHALGPHESADTMVFSTTFALRYAYGIGEVGGLAFDPAAPNEGAVVPIRTTIHELSLHVGSALYF